MLKTFLKRDIYLLIFVLGFFILFRTHDKSYNVIFTSLITLIWVLPYLLSIIFILKGKIRHRRILLNISSIIFFIYASIQFHKDKKIYLAEKRMIQSLRFQEKIVQSLLQDNDTIKEIFRSPIKINFDNLKKVPKDYADFIDILSLFLTKVNLHIIQKFVQYNDLTKNINSERIFEFENLKSLLHLRQSKEKIIQLNRLLNNLMQENNEFYKIVYKTYKCISEDYLDFDNQFKKSIENMKNLMTKKCKIQIQFINLTNKYLDFLIQLHINEELSWDDDRKILIFSNEEQLKIFNRLTDEINSCVQEEVAIIREIDNFLREKIKKISK